MLKLPETAKTGFQHYHYEVREKAGQCKDGLLMTAEECFIAAKKLGYLSKYGQEVEEIEDERKHPGCWIWVDPDWIPSPFNDGILVYYNKNQNGDGTSTEGSTIRSICKIRINGRN